MPAKRSFTPARATPIQRFTCRTHTHTETHTLRTIKDVVSPVTRQVPASFDTFWVAFHSLSSFPAWLASVWVVAVALLPDFAVPALRKGSK